MTNLNGKPSAKPDRLTLTIQEGCQVTRSPPRSARTTDHDHAKPSAVAAAKQRQVLKCPQRRGLLNAPALGANRSANRPQQQCGTRNPSESVELNGIEPSAS
jgi:hypothetical protein